ncbi:hypothetical protein LWI29_013885 [Acer saccharum]|uniref:Uncharacterized protein n=1 Tax=Acer saccharum TaxID=4024 RepID=A0AA39TSU5_ACESA|nr:hypothetical protein LWI29_013885 [Acer saccharum]
MPLSFSSTARRRSVIFWHSSSVARRLPTLIDGCVLLVNCVDFFSPLISFSSFGLSISVAASAQNDDDFQALVFGCSSSSSARRWLCSTRELRQLLFPIDKFLVLWSFDFSSSSKCSKR